MELLIGEDLGRFLSQRGPMDPSTAARIFADASRGLEAAHKLGMIHRDIKPPNIFLHRCENGVVVPKLCDFGIAKQDMSLREHTSTVLTETGGLLGSPLYMSPEQAENAKQATPRSDVWSMAISLYETLCGTSPWGGCSTIGEVMLCLYTKDIPPLTELAPWVDPKLAAVVHHGLQRDVADRFASAQAFADALEPHATRTPLTEETVRAVDGKRSVTKLAIADLPGVSTSRKTATRSRGTAFVGITSLVLAGLLGGLYYGARDHEQHVVPVGSEILHASTATPHPPETLRATLRVSPEDVVVHVNGTETQAMDGGVRIYGRAGDTIRVKIRLGDREHEQSVVITSEPSHRSSS